MTIIDRLSLHYYSLSYLCHQTSKCKILLLPAWINSNVKISFQVLTALLLTALLQWYVFKATVFLHQY